MKQLILKNIEDSLHHNFKVLCAKENISMKDKIVQLIKKVVEKDK